jgi:protein-tyrosine phosphatase
MEELYDIHIHLVFGVDDGPSDIEESEAMLRSAANDGIKTVIATPHKRYGMFEYDIGTVEQNFEKLKKTADELGIALYLGCEYHACSDMIDDIKSGRVHTLGDSKYVLCEFSYATEAEEMLNSVYSLVANGYIPIIAHAERYGVIQDDPGFCGELKKRGAYIQVNSGSILGEEGRHIRKTARTLLKYDLADAVASDAHGEKYRKSSLAKSYDFVVKKYTEWYADKLYRKLPKEIAEKIKKAERISSDE